VTRTAARRLYRLLLNHFTSWWPDAPRAHRRAPLVIARRACTVGDHCERRDLAYAVEGPRARVVLLERALALPDANVVGLLLHELGHLFDPTPARAGAERRADRVARAATGLVVRYDQRDIQTTGRGRAPRPGYLHR